MMNTPRSPLKIGRTRVGALIMEWNYTFEIRLDCGEFAPNNRCYNSRYEAYNTCQFPNKQESRDAPHSNQHFTSDTSLMSENRFPMYTRRLIARELLIATQLGLGPTPKELPMLLCDLVDRKKRIRCHPRLRGRWWNQSSGSRTNQWTNTAQMKRYKSCSGLVIPLKDSFIFESIFAVRVSVTAMERKVRWFLKLATE